MDFKVIGDFWGEFFQQPEDSFRLAALEMVDFQVGCGRHLGGSIQSHWDFAERKIMRNLAVLTVLRSWPSKNALL